MSKKWVPYSLLTLFLSLLIVLPFFTEDYTLYVIYTLFLYISLAQSWNLLGGYSGLISLGHAAFFGVGAYATALTVNYLGLHFLAAALMGGMTAVIFSVVMAIPTFRFHGIYFAIGTIVIAEALRLWMINWDVAGGPLGISFPTDCGTSLTGFYYLMMIVAALATALPAVILKTKLGFGLRAIRDNEASAESIGVNIFRTKLWAFAISAFVAGITGGLYAVKVSTIEPNSIFEATWSLSAINMVIIGGVGTLAGPIFGAVFFICLAELLAGYSSYQLLLTGIILVLIMRFLPGGIWGWLRHTRPIKYIERYVFA